MDLLLPSPLQEIKDKYTESAGVKVYIKRDDLIHPQISGNKWRKLKYNLAEAQRREIATIATFGGSFSNHIYATAAAGKYYKFATIGFIRSERPAKLSSTLNYAANAGMRLIFLDRCEYRMKATSPTVVKTMQQEKLLLLPEGGNNAAGVQGVEEIYEELGFAPDYFCLACGTGCTTTGVLKAAKGQSCILSFLVLKGEGNMVEEISKNIKDPLLKKFNLIKEYHHGGYARVDKELLQFKKWFETEHSILLDYVYTAKAFAGVYNLLQKGRFRKGSTIVIYHSGGLQGNAGIEERYGLTPRAVV